MSWQQFRFIQFLYWTVMEFLLALEFLGSYFQHAQLKMILSAILMLASALVSSLWISAWQVHRRQMLRFQEMVRASQSC